MTTSPPFIPTKEPSPSAMRRILVFVMRHGEREDEVLDARERNRLSPARRFDPALTPQGHRQALEAWKNLTQALSSAEPAPQRVAIFASPLRRVIGTAMMVADAMSGSQCPWKVVVPSAVGSTENALGKVPANEEWNLSTTSMTSIPIVVWNGLCDCAAQIVHMGGHRTAFRTGFVTYAATNQFRPETFSQSPMATTWQEMRHTARQGIPENRQSLSALPIQFWKADHTNQQLEPMTPPLNVADESVLSTRTHDPQVKQPLPFYLKDEPPVDQVVRVALQSGCDVCIVASHREEIRELYKYRCGPQTPRKRLDYCCIGIFEVFSRDTGSDNTISPLDWRLHDVLPYSAMTADFVQDIIDARNPESKNN